jgi:hypothetical protein
VEWLAIPLTANDAVHPVLPAARPQSHRRRRLLSHVGIAGVPRRLDDAGFDEALDRRRPCSAQRVRSGRTVAWRTGRSWRGEWPPIRRGTRRRCWRERKSTRTSARKSWMCFESPRRRRALVVVDVGRTVARRRLNPRTRTHLEGRNV